MSIEQAREKLSAGPSGSRLSRGDTNWVPYFAALVCVFLTLLVALLVRGNTHARETARFNKAVEQTQAAIRSRFETHIALLRGVAAMFAVPDSPDGLISRERFNAYVAQLHLPERYPGIQGIGFSHRTNPGGRDQIVTQMQQAGLDNVQVRPAGDRDEIHIIEYLYPLDERNRNALGFDMFTEPVRRAAMHAASERGEPVASGKVTLVQEIDHRQQAGFLIYVPIYHGPHDTPEHRRANLLGFVYSPLRGDDVFRGIFHAANDVATDVTFDVYDGTDFSRDHLMRGSAGGEVSSAHVPMFRRTTKLEVVGRTWGMVFSSRPEFEATTSSTLVPLVLAMGALVSTGMFVATRAQARARRAAEETAMRLQRSESRVRRLVESNLIGVVFSDLDGAITGGNDEYFRTIGYRREDATSDQLRWNQITPPEYAERDRQAIAELRATGLTAPFEKEYVKKDGTRVPVLLGVAMLEGSNDETVAFTIDLTERKQIENELKRAKENAEAANRAKDEFLAVLSHELRTPLTPVLALAGYHAKDSRLPPDVREDLEMIRRNIELEARLIDDLLDVTRIARGKLELSRAQVDLNELIEQTAAMCCGDDVQAKQLKLEMKLSAGRYFVNGDPARLSQVIWNLLKNAVKFTPARGQVAVHTWNEPSETNGDNSAIVIQISDNGIGIEPGALPHIFQAFHQGSEHVTRSFGGLGLGLAVARALVEAHGGEIRADSPGANRGAVFTIRLPALATEEVEASLVAPSARLNEIVPGVAASASRKRILLVEDHEDTYQAMMRLLQQLGYDVLGARSMEQAVQVGLAEQFDLLVSDIGLPDGSGLSVMDRLRQRVPRFRDAQAGAEAFAAIAVTGYGMDHDVQRSRESGFVAHLTKPVSVDALEQAIRRVFDHETESALAK